MPRIAILPAVWETPVRIALWTAVKPVRFVFSECLNCFAVGGVDSRSLIFTALGQRDQMLVLRFAYVSHLLGGIALIIPLDQI